MQGDCIANEARGNFCPLSHCLYCKEGEALPYRQASLNILLFEGSLAGVASDLYPNLPLLVGSPMGGGCPMCWAGAWPSPGHAYKGQGVCPLMQASRLPALSYSGQTQPSFLPLCGHHTLGLVMLGVPAAHAWAAWATGHRAWPQVEMGCFI